MLRIRFYGFVLQQEKKRKMRSFRPFHFQPQSDFNPQSKSTY